MDEPNHVLLWAGRSTLLLLLILADLANGLALAALWCRPAVRSPSNRFVVSLLIANLVGCGALVPLQLLDTSSGGTAAAAARPIICAFGEAVASAFCAASILSVLLIVGDQYRAVSSPLHYHTPSLVGGKAIGGMWLLTALVGAAAALTSPHQSTLWVSCGFAKTSSPSGVRIAFTVVFSLLVIAVPFAALCWLYSAICDVARGNEARARRCSTVSSSGTGDGALAASHSVPAIADSVRAEGQDADHAGEAPPTEARRHSCPVPARFRRRLSLPLEARAARVSVAVAAMALLCWTPFSVVLALHAMSPTAPPPRLADQLAFAALAASAIASPWLFAYRSRRLRLEIIAVPRRMSRFQVLGSPL